jgi:signal transduction histidine kinase
MTRWFNSISIRWKLAFSFLLVIFITLLVTLLVQRAIIQPRMDDFLRNYSILRRGPEIASVVADSIPNAQNWTELRGLLEQIARLFKVKVFLADANGDLRVQSLLPENIPINESQIDEALIGGTAIGTIVLDQGQHIEVVTSPVYVAGKLVGAVQIAQEALPGGLLVGFSLTSSLLLGGLAAAVVALILVVFLSRGISAPLLKMKQIALKLSRGDFTARLPEVSHDEIGKLASTLNYMATNLEQMEIMRRDLIANVSHELRTPLASIDGYTEAMLDGVIPTDQIEETLQLILAEARRLAKTVSHVLQLSRLESGQIRMEPRPFSLQEEFASLIRQFQLGFEQKGLALASEVPPEPISLLGDPDRIHEVLANLVANALAYSPSNTTVTLFARRESKGQVRLGVQDQGPGIPTESLHRVFERFYQVDVSHSRQTEGVGLGLAIARQIVEGHGSKLEVASEVGEGSCFSFLLPEERGTELGHPN